LVVGTAGDDFWPWIAGDYLYWTHNDYDASVMLIPFGGPDAEPILDVAGRVSGASSAQLPRWNPAGDMLAYTIGKWRLADWGLNLDAGVVAIAPDGTSGPPGSLVAGYHADYTPAWSPDGRWLAYRSRRSPRPVPYYAGPDVADDIFLRRADDPAADEIRLTDFGWEVGGPGWSADGRRLLFDSWDRVPGVSRPWVATIAPESGTLIEVVPMELPGEVSGSVAAVYSPVSDDVLLIERLTPETQVLWIMSPAGEVEKVIEFESHTRGGATWTPEGERVVYSALVDGNMQLFSISRFGGEPQRLTTEPANVMHPQVSPDGRWIAATRLFQRKEIRRLPLR
jgi:dipeptidyl aminopeptidase/acylaminoacyl peptidase